MNEAIKNWNKIISELSPKNHEEFMKILPQAIQMLWNKAIEAGKE
jgi:hypothetical protein